VIPATRPSNVFPDPPVASGEGTRPVEGCAGSSLRPSSASSVTRHTLRPSSDIDDEQCNPDIQRLGQGPRHNESTAAQAGIAQNGRQLQFRKTGAPPILASPHHETASAGEGTDETSFVACTKETSTPGGPSAMVSGHLAGRTCLGTPLAWTTSATKAGTLLNERRSTSRSSSP